MNYLIILLYVWSCKIGAKNCLLLDSWRFNTEIFINIFNNDNEGDLFVVYLISS